MRLKLENIKAFLGSSIGAGCLLFFAAVAAIVVANSGLSSTYSSALHSTISLNIGPFSLSDPVEKWINDFLMAIFFLLVGLEIKRELLSGELSSFSRAMMPAIAAVGGMIVPALIFSGFNFGDAVLMRGWAVPVATDIAFSLGVLAILGTRAPLSIKVFLTAVAVIDDLGAIAIIAFFYTDNLQINFLALSGLVFAAMLSLNLIFKVTSRKVYILLGAVLWYFMHSSGVHATLAGVFTALCVPHLASKGLKGSHSPLEQLEHKLHNPVTYFILPLFAFANAGVDLSGIKASVLFTETLPVGITLGLLIGKPIGICGAIWLGIKFGIGTLPKNTDWPMIFAMSLLCGIGFTVSLFIGNLGFAAEESELLNLVKVGVLAGSTLAGICGYLVMHKVANYDGSK